MSNKRNNRRHGQRVRSEINRKPRRVTKSTDHFLASLPAERARKESQRYWKRPTKAEARVREKMIRRWRVSGKPRKQRKPRTNYGHTYWSHSHDV